MTYLRVGPFAAAFLGSDSKSNRHTVTRMVDRGELAAVRVGERGDRLIPADELDRLREEAEANRRD